MDKEKKIAEIREALEKVTPWPWKIAYTTDGYVLLDADDRELAFFDSIRRADVARFIVNVPEWIRFLLSELERKDEVIEEQKRQLFYKSQEIAELREKSWQDQQWFKQASANVTEMQKELDREREESRKLREDIERIIEILKNGQRAHWQTFKIRQLLGVTVE